MVKEQNTNYMSVFKKVLEADGRKKAPHGGHTYESLHGGKKKEVAKKMKKEKYFMGRPKSELDKEQGIGKYKGRYE